MPVIIHDGNEIAVKNADFAFGYAKCEIEGRWPEAESFIMQDANAAYLYARDILKERWIEAEPVIMVNPYEAYMYAREVIKGAWLEAEPYIIKDHRYWTGYFNRPDEKIIIAVKNGVVTGVFSSNPDTSVKIHDYDAAECEDDYDVIEEEMEAKEAKLHTVY